LPEFDHREDAEDYLTGEIIQRWRILDTANRAAALRRENGNLPEGWDAGLAYEYNDRQITYAQLHAKMLFTMIDAKQRDDRWRKRYGWESVEHQPDREGSVYRDYLNEFTEMFDLEEYGSVGELKDPANVLADRYRQLTERMQKADASAYRERSLLQAWYEGRPLEK